MTMKLKDSGAVFELWGDGVMQGVVIAVSGRDETTRVTVPVFSSAGTKAFDHASRVFHALVDAYREKV